MKSLTYSLSFVFAGLLIGVANAQTSLICRLAPGVSPSVVARKYGVSLRDFTLNAPFALYVAANDTLASKVQDAMGKDRSIAWVEDDEAVGSPEDESKGRPSKGGGLPAVGDRHGLQTINKNLLSQIDWSVTVANTSGRVVRIAILDTGLSPKQPALWTKVDASINVIEPGKPAYDMPHGTDTNQNWLPDEAVGHGTMVAGIVDQIAPQVRFNIARIADSDGFATAWTVIKGLAFAVTSKSEVANISLGSLTEVPALSDVMEWCVDNRLLIVAPIGNNGQNVACYPAKINEAICVGGLDTTNHKATFSNWHSICAVSAPAVGFASQFWDGQLAVWSGTSFASPVVAASIAEALRHTFPSTPRSLRQAISRSGSNLDGINPSYKGKLGVLVDFSRVIQVFKKA